MRIALLLAVLFSALSAKAQWGSCPTCWVIDGEVNPALNYAVTFPLQTGPGNLIESVGSTTLELDTTGCQLWQIGQSDKLFFYDAGLQPCRGILTDTLLPYPMGANEAFILKLSHLGFNTIIGFNHRYWTQPGHDGGVVEFSLDSGATWLNVKGRCNADSTGEWFGILTDRFYAATDTLLNSDTAFSGISAGWVNSRVQFFQGLPVKPGGAEDFDCLFNSYSPLWLRFRFVSDTAPDSLGGWLIGDITIEYDYFGSSVAGLPAQAGGLAVSPNPSATGIFRLPAWPASGTEPMLAVYDATGRAIRPRAPYPTAIDLSAQPPGVYFYEVLSGGRAFRGKLLRQ